MNPRILMAFGAVLFLVIGCSASLIKETEKERPIFEAERYLTASGLGASEAEARREALAGLAAVFESRVHAETATTAASFISDSTPEAFEKSVEAKVKIESSVHLEGARIGWVRRDEKSGLFQALAVIDRNQAARQWYDQMDLVDTRMQAELSALPGLNGRLIRMAALNRILEAALEKAALRSRLRVIGRFAGGAEAVDLQPIADEAAVIRSDTAFFVDIEGGQGEEVAARIEGELGNQGFGVTRDPARAAGSLTGTVNFTPLDLGNRQVHFVRVAIRLALVDVDTGIQMAAIAEDIRKGHVDEREAVRTAVEAVSSRAAGELFETLGLMGFSDANLPH